MNNNWEELWNNKRLDTESPDLGTLIAMVGWKSSDGDLSEQQFLKFVSFVAGKLNISAGDRILEIGCGPGGFLLPFYQNGYAVTGLDYSESLIQICRKVMPNGQFHRGEANHLPFPDQPFDVILSNSVCHYFPDHTYMEQVLSETSRCLASGGRGAVLDANDAAKEEAFMQHRYERFGGKEEYDRQNQGLGQLFYRKEWLMSAGARHGLTGYIEDQVIERYHNTPYRFNYFFAKQ